MTRPSGTRFDSEADSGQCDEQDNFVEFTPFEVIAMKVLDSWLIFACRSSYAAEAAECIWRTGGHVKALVDNWSGEPFFSDIAPVIGPEAVGEEDRALAVTIPLITPGHRAAAQADAGRRGMSYFPVLADPTAVVSRTACIGTGVSINGLTIIGARSCIGRFCLINRSASIGHDAELHDFVTLGPGVVLAGHIVIESGAFVGAGAVLAPKVRVGLNAVVGAGAVVMQDVPPHAVVVGNPARVLRVQDCGYSGTGIDADTLTL